MKILIWTATTIAHRFSQMKVASSHSQLSISRVTARVVEQAATLSLSPFGYQITVSFFTVTATTTCTLAVFNQAAAQTMAESISVANNAPYAFASTPTAQVTQATLPNPQNGVIALTVQAQGIGVYHFSNAQQQQFAQLITDKSFDQAKNILDAQPGVASAKITGGNQFLPSNAQAITIVTT